MGPSEDHCGDSAVLEYAIRDGKDTLVGKYELTVISEETTMDGNTVHDWSGIIKKDDYVLIDSVKHNDEENIWWRVIRVHKVVQPNKSWEDVMNIPSNLILPQTKCNCHPVQLTKLNDSAFEAWAPSHKGQILAIFRILMKNDEVRESVERHSNLSFSTLAETVRNYWHIEVTGRKNL